MLSKSGAEREAELTRVNGKLYTVAKAGWFKKITRLQSSSRVIKPGSIITG